VRLKAPPLPLKSKQAEAAANDIDVNATELLATWVLYRLWVGILAPVLAFSAFIAITKASAFPIPTVGMGAITATVIAWLQTTRLALVNGEVRYRSLLVSTRLSASEIASAEFLMGFSSFKRFQRIVFRMRGSNKEITLNAGLFELKLVKRWVEELSRHLG
jgi:hypothetical protein